MIEIMEKKIKRIMLVDGWHDVRDNSFCVDKLHFDGIDGLMGFTYVGTNDIRVLGPISAIMGLE